jgi:ubiquinone/menaquinone biosynthesis C-methylase UbiE
MSCPESWDGVFVGLRHGAWMASPHKDRVDVVATRDLHDGFRDPTQVPADQLIHFLEAADRLPGMRAAQRAMREAIDPRPGLRLLDAGCGIGLEAARLAKDYPGLHVTGLDRNAEMLAHARQRAPTVAWLDADLTDLDLPAASFDVVRTERVLMYLPGDAFERVVDALVELLAPGGRMTLFELDYGGTILAPGGAADGLVDRVALELYDSLPQPRAGRVLPRLLAERGLGEISGTPFSFTPGDQVWRRIVKDTVLARSPAPDVADWLERQGLAAARGEFVGAFTGVLTTATRRPTT